MAHRCVIERIHQQMPEAMAAVKIGVHEFESDFIDSGAAQKHLAANMAHANCDIDFRIRANTKGIFLEACSTTQADFAHRNC